MSRLTTRQRVEQMSTRELWQLLIRHVDELWELNRYWKTPPERRERARWLYHEVHELANRGTSARLFDTSDLPARGGIGRDLEA